jgi:hypothetical protein
MGPRERAQISARATSIVHLQELVMPKTAIYHPPLTLATDAGTYCTSIANVVAARNEGAKKSDPTFAIPGNGDDDLAAVAAAAKVLLPIEQQISDLEAQLAALQKKHDAQAVDLWHLFTEARDLAQIYADKHDCADVQAVTSAYVYHARRAHRAIPPVAAPTTGGLPTPKAPA